MKKISTLLIAILLTVLAAPAQAARNFDGTNDGLARTATVVFDATTIETQPISLVCWIKRGRSSAASVEYLMIGGISAGATNHFQALGINTGNTVFAKSRTTGESSATSTATITDTTTWHLVVAVFASITSRKVYVDNNAVNTESTSRDPSTATGYFSIGANGTDNEFQGLIAYPTVYFGALSDADVLSLYNSGAGVDPQTVVPSGGSVRAHWLLTANTSPEASSVGSFDLTVSGTTFSTDNPFTIGGGGGSGMLLRRRRAANDDHFELPWLAAVGF